MNAFRLAVDMQGWTFSSNEQGTDYGLDGEVEIFDGDSATGLTFRVQVKGKDTGVARPSRIVKSKHLNYWAALGVPVLLVHHVVATGATYVKWVHRYDRGPSKSKQKTVTIRFDETDRLEARIQALPDEVIGFREADRDLFPRPIPLVVSGSPQDRETDFFHSLRTYIEQNGLSDLLRPTLKPQGSGRAFRVVLKPRHLRVSQPLDVASISTYWRKPLSQGEEGPIVLDAISAIVVIGVMLGALGSVDDAERLLAASTGAGIVPYQQGLSLIIASICQAKRDTKTRLLSSRGAWRGWFWTNPLALPQQLSR